MTCRDRQPLLLTLQVAFEHQPYRSTSMCTVEFPSSSSIGRLKEEMAHRVKLRAELQRWYYRGQELHDNETIVNLNLNRDAIIFIRQTESFHGVQERGAEMRHPISKST